MVDAMFINNKYKSWYDSIIQKANNRTISTYKEKHHILPRCLGGKDNQENLVELTAREHFIVHMLLCKFTKGQARIKMLYAFNFMSVVRSKYRDYKINSKIAQKLRKEFFSNKPRHTTESKLKMSKSRLGVKLSKETRKKVGLAQLGNKKALGLKHSEETKKMLTFEVLNLIINKGGNIKVIEPENGSILEIDCMKDLKNENFNI